MYAVIGECGGDGAGVVGGEDFFVGDFLLELIEAFLLGGVVGGEAELGVYGVDEFGKGG